MACCFKNSTSTNQCQNGVFGKVCIEAKRVFDACISRRNESLTLTVDFGTESAVSIQSIVNNGDSTLSSIVVTPIPDTCTSRVQYTATIPLTIVGTNSSGTTITGTATTTVEQDIVLSVPQNGMIVPEIEATVLLRGLQNTVINGNVVTTNACITIITKVVADVILSMSTYGYPTLPVCQEYTQDVCSGVFNTPVYPR